MTRLLSFVLIAALAASAVAADSPIPREVTALVESDARKSWDAAQALLARPGSDSFAIRRSLTKLVAERGYAIEMPKRMKKRERGPILDRIRQAALLARLKEKGFEIPEGMIVIPGGVGKRPLTGEVVEVASFLIDRIEVSNAEWRRYAAEVGKDAEIPKEGAGRIPVAGIDRAAAMRFARWRKARLPTAEEWLLARGGCAGLAFPWGTRKTKGAANVLDEGVRALEPCVGRPEGATALGVMRMAGNAAEWTSSAWGAPRTKRGVLAGESWLSSPSVGPVLRATSLGTSPQTAGLRCATSLR